MCIVFGYLNSIVLPLKKQYQFYGLRALSGVLFLAGLEKETRAWYDILIKMVFCAAFIPRYGETARRRKEQTK